MRAGDNARHSTSKDRKREQEEPALLKPCPPGPAVDEPCVDVPIVDPDAEPPSPREARGNSKPIRQDDSSEPRSARSA